MCGVGAVCVVLDERVCEDSVVDVDKQCVSVRAVLVGVCVSSMKRVVLFVSLHWRCRVQFDRRTTTDLHF